MKWAHPIGIVRVVVVDVTVIRVPIEHVVGRGA